MLQHCQQLDPFVSRLDNPVILHCVLSSLFHQYVKHLLQPEPFRRRQSLLIGQQIAGKRPGACPKRGQLRLMVRHAWGKLGVMAPIVHPAERVGIREVVRDQDIIAQQPAQHGHLGLRVLCSNHQGITDLLLLLLSIERANRRSQVLQKFSYRHVSVKGQRRAPASHQRVGQARRFQPGYYLVIQPEHWFLALQNGQHILARAAGTGVVAREVGVAHHVTDFVLPIDASAGLVGGNPQPGGKPGLVHGSRLIGPDPVRVEQHARHRARPNGHADIAQEGQQRRLTDVRAMPECQHHGMGRGAPPPAIAWWQRDEDRRLRARHIPDLAREADDLHGDTQPLHDGVSRPVADGIGRQLGRVDGAAFLVGDGQRGVLLRFTARRACLALGFRGVVMQRRLDRGLDIWLPRAALQSRELITQLLVFDTQGDVLGGKRLNEVQQLDHNLMRRQIGNRVGVNVKNLHLQVVYQIFTMLSPSSLRFLEKIRRIKQ